MKRQTHFAFSILRWIFLFAAISAHGQDQQTALPGTSLLKMTGDLSAQMVAGIDQFLTLETGKSIERRETFWHRDFSSRQAYESSVAPNRERLRTIIGAVDARIPVADLELLSTLTQPAKVFETPLYSVYKVRWPVFPRVHGEGLLLEPKRPASARVIVLPDADQTPEMMSGLAPGIPADSQIARRLAENGCTVVVPCLLDRSDTWSGNSRLKRFTNQPHREWIYRQAFELGRHVIGYEVQKVMALVDWATNSPSLKVGVAGYGEGGLIAFYAAALHPQIESTLVSGYFQSRQELWAEPIYRNVFGLLEEFGDAEIASLIVPRRLIIEYSAGPQVEGPPPRREGRSGAAPGRLSTPDQWAVEGEFQRLRKFYPANASVQPTVDLFQGSEGTTVAPGSTRTVLAFLSGLGVNGRTLAAAPTVGDPVSVARLDPAERQMRQLQELEAHTQELLRRSARVREEYFWKPLGRPADTGRRAMLRSNLWQDVIGQFPAPDMPAHARSRQIHDQPAWVGYEVVLDVWPEVFAWGILLLPKDIKEGERRPVVVCQHGLEGVPESTLTMDTKSSDYNAYKGYAAQLAARGYVVFAPHNPYRGQDRFRVLQRKANPLKKSLFSIITGQHSRILDWLEKQPFVDPARIGFYGLSYGGKTAMRVPALLDRYALSICSADFNEWIVKNATVDSPYSYMFTGEYEMPEFNLGNTFNYAEMAALIAPRPFMVERGHNDGVAPDEWVAHEFARVRRHYADLKLSDRTEIEFFPGPHTINGVGTFRFLDRHLKP